MGLKFRRGTTAQKSGSLAFGEPYVNTTLGTLQIGLDTGDVTLSAIGTGSNISVAEISGSSINITGNAKVDGKIIISSGSILGNVPGFAAYISTSINDGTLGLDTTANVNALYFLKNGEKNFEVSYDTTNANGIFRLLPYDNNSFFEIGNPSNSGADYIFVAEPTYGNILMGRGIPNGTGYFEGAVVASDKVQIAGAVYVSGSLRANSLTGSIAATNGVVSGSSQVTLLLPTGVVSGSSQVTLSSTTGYSDFSSSLNSRILTEKGRVDAILSAADADKDSFAEIVTLINSVDTTNDNAFASFYTASVGRLNNLESTSGSVNISVSNLNTFSGSALTRLSALEVETANLESFTSSINTTIKNRLDANTVVSGSSQVIGILSSLNTYTGSNDTTNTTQNSRLDQLSTASGSAITRLSALEVETANLETFSSSALTRLSTLEGKDISITLTGDVTGTGTITDLTNVSFATTIAANSVALGTDTTGDYVASLVAGTNITLSNNSGEGATPTIGLTNNAITIAGTSTSLGGTITAEQIRTAIGTVVTGSAQISLGSASGNIALATQTTGDYVASLVQGTGVTITNNSGENATPTIAIGQSVATNATPTFGNLTINGSINATGDITAYYTSDKRHKNNIQPIENALLKVSKLNGVTWEWNDDVHEVTKSTPKTGLIAQEVQEVLPEVIKEREDGFLALDYSKMMGLMVEAIKEQQTQIHNLTLEIENLKKVKGL